MKEIIIKIQIDPLDNIGDNIIETTDLGVSSLANQIHERIIDILINKSGLKGIKISIDQK